MALVTDKVPEGYLREMRQLMMDISNGDALGVMQTIFVKNMVCLL